MNEPVRSLTQDQSFTLKSTYMCLCHVVMHLEERVDSLAPDSEDRLHLENVLELATLCIARLRENFPECGDWQQKGGAS
jgi:hypothetical protein